MTYSFNLIDKSWIPCLTLAGEREEFGIRDVLMQAHELREIRGDTPLETASLYRLLLAILHRILGPENPRVWKSLWNRLQFDIDVIDAYLLQSSIHQCFDLFHPQKPFYQPCKQVENKESPSAKIQKGKMPLEEFLKEDTRNGVEPTSVISLLLHAASGGNAVLFDHNTKAVGLSLTPAQAARALITSQLFGFGGTSGVKENFTDAFGSKGVLFLAQGQSVFETLMLNMIEYGEDKPLPTPDGNDLPAWEMADPFIPDRERPKGYLDYLTWHNRRIWLRPQEIEGQVIVRDMYWAPGLKLDIEDVDPMMHYFVDKESGIRPLSFTATRALWRDSKVLFELEGVDKPPKVVRWLADLAQPPVMILDTTQRYKLMALGIAKNKASLEFLRSESLPLPLEFLKNQDLVGELGRALQVADNCVSTIRVAAFVLAWLTLYPATKSEDFATSDKIGVKLESGGYPQSRDEQAKRAYNLFTSWSIERYYWSELGIHFHSLVENLPNAPELALQTWRDQMRRTATAAFQQAEKCAGKDNRAMRAAAVARQRFYIGLADAVGKASTHNSTEGGEEL
jgi:CRISPR system Cascade subunit CasA